MAFHALPVDICYRITVLVFTSNKSVKDTENTFVLSHVLSLLFG